MSSSNKVDTKLLIDFIKVIKVTSVINNKVTLLSSDINIVIILILKISNKVIKLVLNFNGKVEPASDTINLAK